MDRQPIKVREQSGVHLNATRTEFVHGKLRMLGDRIAVKPLPVVMSTIVLAERQGSFRGTVLAVGPGEYPNRYNRDRSKVWKSKAFRPTEIKVGDIVELGGQEHTAGYAFPRINLNGEDVVIASEKDVAAVHQSV
jgi:co-chaperonin GroES (HSP10)